MINWSEEIDLNLFVFDAPPGTPQTLTSPAPATTNAAPAESPTDSGPSDSQGSLGFSSGRLFDFDTSPGDLSSYNTVKLSDIDGSIELISIERVIERVTLNPEPILLNALLRTHTAFCSSEELMDAFAQRLMNVNANESDTVKERLIIVMKEWLQKCPEEFEEGSNNRQNLQPLLRLLRAPGKHDVRPLIREIEILELQDRVDGTMGATAGIAAPTPNRKMLAPQTVVPPLFAKNATTTPFTATPSGSVTPKTPAAGRDSVSPLSLDPLELAKQLTVIDQHYLQKIKASECLDEAFSGSTVVDYLLSSRSATVEADSPFRSCPASFREWADWTHRISRWTILQISLQESLRSRVRIFILFLETANHLRSLGNFNSLLALTIGMLDPAITRLKQTIGAFHAKLLSIQATISAIASKEHNFAALRDVQDKAPKPSIPSLLLLLHDLTCAHAQPFISPEDDRLYFQVMTRVAACMETVSSAQELLYPYPEIPSIRSILESVQGVPAEDMDTLSQFLEPAAGTERGAKPRLLLTEEELRKLVEDSEAYKLNSPGRTAMGAEWTVSLGRDGQEFEVIFIPGYRFYSRDTSYNIRIDYEDGVAVIRAANLEKLIEHITPAKSSMQDDSELLRIFFTCFHGFATSQHVLDLLAMRYQPPHLKSQDPLDIKMFQETYEIPVRNRVCAVLLYWLRTCPTDFTNVQLREKMRDFLVEKVSPVQPEWAQTLLKTLDARMMTGARSASGGSRTLVAPVKLSASVAILDFDPAEVAMQLSLLVHEAWRKIRTPEMLNLSWLGPQAHTTSPNILAFMGLIDKIVYNVEVELTRLLNSANRQNELAKTISAWLQVAQRSQQHLTCWPSAQAIVRVLEYCYTQELSQVWEKVPRPLLKYFLVSRALFANQGEFLSAALAPFSEAAVSWRLSTTSPLSLSPDSSTPSPSIADLALPRLTARAGVLPLEIILDDISLLEATQPNLLLEMGPRVINFDKYRHMSDIFQLVILTQKSDYASVELPKGYVATPEPRLRSWLLREPRADEIPAQRFQSRFQSRVSIRAEDILAATRVQTPPARSPSNAKIGAARAPPSRTSSNSSITVDAVATLHHSTSSSSLASSASSVALLAALEAPSHPHTPHQNPSAPGGSNLDNRSHPVLARYQSAILPTRRTLVRSVTESPTHTERMPEHTLRSRPLPPTPSAPSPEEPAPPPKSSTIPTPEAFLTLVKANSSILNELFKEVLAESRATLLRSPEVSALVAENVRLKNQRDNKLFLALERDSEGGKHNQIKKMMKAKFPHFSEFALWRHLDKSGTVFGFEYPITLTVGTSGTGKALCDLVPKADIGDVSILLKASRLYEELYPDTAVECFLLGDEFTDAAKRAANKTGIELVKIELPSIIKKSAPPATLERRSTLATTPHHSAHINRSGINPVSRTERGAALANRSKPNIQ